MLNAITHQSLPSMKEAGHYCECVEMGTQHLVTFCVLPWPLTRQKCKPARLLALLRKRERAHGLLLPHTDAILELQRQLCPWQRLCSLDSFLSRQLLVVPVQPERFHDLCTPARSSSQTRYKRSWKTKKMSSQSVESHKGGVPTSCRDRKRFPSGLK